jgi:PEP-CTERM motif
VSSVRLPSASILLFMFAVALAGVLAVPAMADSTFQDSTFNLSNYTQTGIFRSDPLSTLTVSHCAACGDPGAGLMFFTTNVNVATTAVGLVGKTFIYNPATQGALSTVDASVDKDLTANFVVMGTPLGNTFRPLIEQDGVFYLAAISGPGISGSNTTGYNLLSQAGLTAADFLSYDFSTGTFGTANPNFNGDAMQFGLGQIFGTGGPFVNLEADYDNLQLNLHSAPEPGTLLLLGLGLGTLALVARKA